MWWKISPSRKELMVQLSQLTRQMSEVTEKLQKQTMSVTVQSLHVDQATLERLVFRLDSLDIHDLSGSLNLGNNFQQPTEGRNKVTHQVQLRSDEDRTGGRVEQTAVLRATGSTPSEASAGPQESHRLLDNDSQLRLTNRGYRVRFGEQASSEIDNRVE